MLFVKQSEPTQRYQTETSLSGSILFSHPTLKDPNFAQSIVFLSAHSKDQGTIGVILNRPIHKSLTELDVKLDCGELSDVPVFEGGPVEKDKLIISLGNGLIQKVLSNCILE